MQVTYFGCLFNAKAINIKGPNRHERNSTCFISNDEHKACEGLYLYPELCSQNSLLWMSGRFNTQISQNLYKNGGNQNDVNYLSRSEVTI